MVIIGDKKIERGSVPENVATRKKRLFRDNPKS
jgi:hypothetical protein